MLRHLLLVSALLQCGWPSCVDGFVGSVYRAKYVTVLRRVDVKPSVVAVGKREVKKACAARRVPPHQLIMTRKSISRANVAHCQILNKHIYVFFRRILRMATAEAEATAVDLTTLVLKHEAQKKSWFGG